MANFKLTELTDAAGIQNTDIIYLVQNDISKKITFENIFSSIPATTIVGDLNVTSGTVLSGSVEIEETLKDTFQQKDRKEILEFPIRNLKDARGAHAFPEVGGLPLSAFSNAVIFLSGDASQGDNTTGYQSKAFIKIEQHDIDQLPIGFNIKVVQLGSLTLAVSGGSGVTINNDKTTSTNMLGLSTKTNFSALDIYKLPDSTSFGVGRFAVVMDSRFQG
mgnify:CR=1 FL=1|jgi:hypothetical protein